MMQSNGKGDDHEAFAPKIHPEVQKLLDRAEQRRQIDDDIRFRLGAAVAELLAQYPDHRTRIAAALEGSASMIHRDLENENRRRREIQRDPRRREEKP